MGVRVLSKSLFFWLLFSSVFSIGAQKKPVIQRGIIDENNSIVYKIYDFDSEQIARLPRNKIVVISTRIYRPENLFGSFYKVYINKPKKIRGYISEVDIIPQYKRAQGEVLLNEDYRKREFVLKKVKTTQDVSNENSPSPQKEKTSSPQVQPSSSDKNSQNRKSLLGVSVGWMSPVFEQEYRWTPVFGSLHWIHSLKWNKTELPFEMRVGVSPFPAYEVRESSPESGFIIEGHLFPLWEGFQGMSLGGGFAWKYEKDLDASYELNLGLGASLNFIFEFTQILWGRFSLEYKHYFNEGENPNFNLLIGFFYRV